MAEGESTRLAQSLRRIWSLLGYRRRYDRSALVLHLVLMNACDFLILYSLNQAIARHYAESEQFGAFLVFAVAVLMWVMTDRWLVREVATRVNETLHRATLRIGRMLRRASLEEVERLGEDKVLVRLTADAQVISNLSPVAIEVPRATFRLLTGFVYALTISPQAAVLAAAGSVALAALVSWQHGEMEANLNLVGEKSERSYALVKGLFFGFSQVKQNSRRRASIRQTYEDEMAELLDRRERTFARFLDQHHLLNTAFYAILAANVFLLPLVAPVGAQDIRDINLILLWTIGSLFGLANVMPIISMLASAQRRVLEIEESLRIAPQEPEPQRPDAGANGFEALALRGVTFTHRRAEGGPSFELSIPSVTLRAGELVLVTGHNGSGKSTFLKVLTGLYRADTGSFSINGEHVAPDDIATVRALFSVLFTDDVLFPQYHDIHDEDDERAAEILAMLKIDHKTSIRGGVLGARDLSTGQKKRLAMAVALLQDRPILAFDESAADQDPSFREFYYRTLLPSLRDQGKLIIAVTHDDQYFDVADHCLQFRRGRLEAG